MKSNLNSSKIEYLRIIYMSLLVVYAIIRECVPLNFLIQSSLVSLVVFVFGGLFILYDLLVKKVFTNTPYVICLILYILICLITSIINRKYGIVGNVKSIAILVLEFFVIYPFMINYNDEDSKKHLKTLLIVFVSFWSLCILVSVPMYYFNVGYVVNYLDACSQGFSSEYNRLWGILAEANCAAVYSVISIIACIYLAASSKKTIIKVLLSLDIIIIFSFIVLAVSRTAKVVTVLAVFYLVLYFAWYKIQKFGKLKVLVAICLAVICAGVSLLPFKALEHGLPALKNQFLKVVSGSAYTKAHIAYDKLYLLGGNVEVLDGLCADVEIDVDEEEIAEVLEREDVNSSDISNGRMDRWKSALLVYKTAPIFGTSLRNYSEYAKDNCPNALAALYGFTVHNSYLEILVYTGIIGFLVFASFLLLSAFRAIKGTLQKKQFVLEDYIALAFCITLAAASFFHADLFFIFRLGGVLFWLSFGYLVKGVKDESQCDNSCL